MGTLTRLNALIGELEPYTAGPAALQKALADAGVEDPEADYTAADRKSVALAAVIVLRKLVVLTSDSQGKSSQGYSVDKLEDRIEALCRENGLDVDEFVAVPSIEDASNRW